MSNPGKTHERTALVGSSEEKSSLASALNLSTLLSPQGTANGERVLPSL